MGCCSHIATILWFAGVKRLKIDEIKLGPSQFYQNYCEDAADSEEKPQNISDDDEI